MDLIIDYETGPLVIQLINNPLVRDWANKLNVDKAWDCWNVPQCVYYGEKEQYRLSLINAIQDFNHSTGITFPFAVTSTTDFTRKDLNDIHRFFTTGSSFASWTLGSDKIIDSQSKDFAIFYEKISVINDVVHFLENYYDCDEKQQSKDVVYQFLKLKDMPREDFFQHRVGDWRYLDYNCEYDVFMNWAICGKDYFQAYIDQDDARQWDITAQWSSYYNFLYIDINGERNKVMKSEQFTKFLKDAHVHNTAWQYMPIGKIVKGTVGHYSTFKGIRLN
jgi:hypothetical protein